MSPRDLSRCCSVLAAAVVLNGTLWAAAQQIPAPSANPGGRVFGPANSPASASSEGWSPSTGAPPRVVALAPAYPLPSSPTTAYQGPFGNYIVPVKRQRWVPRWQGRWNPFVRPYLAYHYVTETSWERAATAPLAARAAAGLEPTRTAQVLAVRPSPQNAHAPVYGGVARYDIDPPRGAVSR